MPSNESRSISGPTSLRGVQRVADRDAGIGLLQPRHQGLVDVAVDDQPAQAGAALAGGADRREQDGADGQFQVGGRRHDHRVVAAKLQDGAGEALGQTGADFTAHAGAAGGADQGDAPVVDQTLADGAVADQDRRQAVGSVAEPGRRTVEQRLAGERRERGLLRRLPHHRIAADDGERRVPRPDRDRKVEGGDHADGTQRMPCLGHAVAGAFRCDGQAVELARQADGEVADVDHLLNFAVAFLDRLAAFQRDQLAQSLLVGAQLLAQQADQLAAPGGGDQTPCLEGFGGGGDLGVGRLGRVVLEAGDLRPVDRAAHDAGASLKQVGVQVQVGGDVPQGHDGGSGRSGVGKGGPGGAVAA